MRYKKAVETTQVYLENTPLPVYGKIQLYHTKM